MDVYLRAAKLSTEQRKRLTAGAGVKKPFEEENMPVAGKSGTQETPALAK